MNEILTVEEVAQLLRCTEQTVMEELRAGKLPGIKIGREWILPRDAFFTNLNGRATCEAARRCEQLLPLPPPGTLRPRKVKLPADYNPNQLYTHDQAWCGKAS